jgi:multidrug resistance efflux pump
MATNFSHTMRSLELDRGRVRWLIPALLTLAAWSAWMLLGRVEVYASASRARVEVSRMVHRVAAEANGRIVLWRLELGQVVQAGELLVELDASVERAEWAHQAAELSGIESKLAAARSRILAERAKQRARSRVAEVEQARAALGVEQARVTASQQQELAGITSLLREQQLTSRLDAIAADKGLESSRLGLHDAALGIERLSATQSYERKVEQAQLAELESQVADLEAERSVRSAALGSIQVQIERRRLLAPASGKLGNVAALQVGDVARAGEVLASIIPEDDVRIVAEFAPERAVGRILPGARARVRFDSFAWTEFGMLSAVVTHVASEPSDGVIRVELAMTLGQLTAIPVQHGLPASVDVLLERVSPASLVQGSVGLRLTRSSARPARAASAEGTDP